MVELGLATQKAIETVRNGLVVMDLRAAALIKP